MKHASYGYNKQTHQLNDTSSVVTKTNLLLQESERLIADAMEDGVSINPLIDFTLLYNQGGR